MKQVDFSLEDKDHIKLCDLMNLAGLCESAGSAKHIIANGEVKVDEVIELRKRAKIISGQMVEYKEKKVRIV